MAGLTWANLKTQMGNTFDPNQATSHEVWLKFAYHDVVTAARWSWRETESAAVALVAGQSKYKITGGSPVIPDFAGMVELIVEYTASGQRQILDAIDSSLYDRWSNKMRVNGVPVAYAEVGGAGPTSATSILAGAERYVAVWPFPLATAGNGVNLFFRYLRGVDSVEPSADANVPLVPVRHQQAILWRAMEYGYAANRQYQNAAEMNQRASAKLVEMADEDGAIKPTLSSTIVMLQSRPVQPPAAPELAPAPAGRKAA